MTKREDGKETRARILESACEIFAEKGFQAAKVAEICRRAGANVAAVNYYFSSKANLYVEAWRQAFENCPAPESPDPSITSQEKRLKIYIRSMIEHFAKNDEHGRFTRLYLLEMANPTGLIHKVWQELITPRRQVLLDIIRKIMKKDQVDEKVLFCEMSIISQCRSLMTIRDDDLEYLLGQPLSIELIQKLTDHIVRFSLAGITHAV